MQHTQNTIHRGLFIWAAFTLLVGLLFTASIMLLPHSAFAQTGNVVTYPAVGPFNGFLNQLNVYECVNSGSKEITAKLEVFRNNGEAVGSVSRKIAPTGGTEHFILNELRDANGKGIENDYGVVIVSVPGETAPMLNCLPAFYRLSGNNAVEYAYAIPLTNAATAATFGIYNTFDPSGKNQNTTDNWLSVFNPSATKDFTGEVRTYKLNSQGTPITLVQNVTLRPFQRYDFYLGTPGEQSTGIYEVRPTGTSPGTYQAFLNRYQQNSNGAYNFAFSLASTDGKCGEQLNASTMGNAHNWLEMGNPTATAAQVAVDVRDRNGLLLNTQNATIAPFAQLHIYLNQYIDPEGSGDVGTVRVRCANASQKLLVQSAFYGRDRSDATDISWAYVSQAKGALQATTNAAVVGTINTFLNAANWLKLINTSVTPASVGLFGLASQGRTTVFQQSRSLTARGGADVALHELVGGNDKTGSVVLLSSTSGISYTGEVLRVFLNSNNGIDYIMPTPLVVLSGGLESSIDDLRPVANAQTVSVAEKGSVNITLSGSDPKNKPLTYRLISSPPNGTVTGTAPAVRFTAGFARGTETFQFVTNNGRFDSIPATVSVNVSVGAGTFAGSSTSLKPYRNSLSAPEIQHLISKAEWGSPALAAYAATHTLDQVIDQMIAGYGSTADENSAMSLADSLKHQTQTNYVIADDGTKATFTTPERWEWNFDALRTYWLYHMRYGNALKERMAFILHDQFALNMTSINSSANYHHFMKAHLDLLRSHALSDPGTNGAPQGFDDLAIKMTSDGAMLLWLDNWLNTYSTPNQNYAREVMELFTLGARDPITNAANYGEADIVGSARAVSGYTLASTAVPMVFANPLYPSRTSNVTVYNPTFDARRWMQNPAAPTDIEVFIGQPSYIKSGLNNTSFLNHILYVHPGAARFIASRLFSTFVHPQPTEAVVAELANDLRGSQYNLRTVLKKILKSEAMFSATSTEGCIMGPTDAVLKLVRSLEIPFLRSGNYDMYTEIRNEMLALGHAPFAPPNVFGWKGCIGPRNGITYRGENWLVAQALLERERQVTNLLNRLNDFATLGMFRWTDLMPPLNSVAQPYVNTLPEATVDSLTARLGLRPNLAERPILIRYLTTVRVSNSATPYNIRHLWDPANASAYNAVVAQKMPGLIQLLFNSTDYNLQ